MAIDPKEILEPGPRTKISVFGKKLFSVYFQGFIPLNLMKQGKGSIINFYEYKRF